MHVTGTAMGMLAWVPRKLGEYRWPPRHGSVLINITRRSLHHCEEKCALHGVRLLAVSTAAANKCLDY
jgi:hypothetical protein